MQSLVGMHTIRSVSSARGVRVARINFGQVIGDLGPRGFAVPPTRFSTTESGAAGSWSGSDSAELLRDLTKDEVIVASNKQVQRTYNFIPNHITFE